MNTHAKAVPAAMSMAVAALLMLGGCAAETAQTTPAPSAAPPVQAAPATPGSPAAAPGSSPPTASGSPAASPGASGQAATGMLRIDPTALNGPAPVLPGATVTVMNTDDWSHRVTADDGTSFGVYVPSGGTVTFKAPTKPGRYPFHTDGPASGPGAARDGVVTVLSAEPSEAARMVCASEARESVKTILALPGEPAVSAGFADGLYTCTYDLPVGTFTMSVQESSDKAAAEDFARNLAGKLAAEPVKGMANLGFSGYRSETGSVVFAKDNMTLHVDATALPPTLGPHGVSPSDFAFEMATTILACWTEHH